MPLSITTDDSYYTALVTFRDLLDDCEIALSNEYVRGGVNLLADLHGVAEMDVSERMDQIIADLNSIPMFCPVPKARQIIESAGYKTMAFIVSITVPEDAEVGESDIERALYLKVDGIESLSDVDAERQP